MTAALVTQRQALWTRRAVDCAQPLGLHLLKASLEETSVVRWGQGLHGSDAVSSSGIRSLCLIPGEAARSNLARAGVCAGLLPRNPPLSAAWRQ